MKTKTNTTTAVWAAMLSNLSWTNGHAIASARFALSKAAWLGIEGPLAMRLILEIPAAARFHEEPHLLFETWREVRKKMPGLDGAWNWVDEVITQHS